MVLILHRRFKHPFAAPIGDSDQSRVQVVRLFKSTDRHAPAAWAPAGLTSAALLAVATAAGAQPLPQGAHPGECYQQVAAPPVYRTVTQTVAGPPAVSYRHIPAVTEQVTRTVIVTPARTDWESRPAVYRTVPRFSEIPGPTRLVRSAPVYRTITKQTLVAPAHLEWRQSKRNNGFAGGGDGYGQSVRPTGEVMCRVLVPARYALARRRVMVSPGGFHRVSGPPRRVVCYVKVLVQPAQRIAHPVAATYRSVTVTVVKTPATTQRIVTPGAPRVISRQVRAPSVGKTWSRIVCRPHAVAPPRPVAPPPPQVSTGYGARSGYGAPAAYAPPQATPVPPHAFRPDEVIVPTPVFKPLTPAPYDVGHPAR